MSERLKFHMPNRWIAGLAAVLLLASAVTAAEPAVPFRSEKRLAPAPKPLWLVSTTRGDLWADASSSGPKSAASAEAKSVETDVAYASLTDEQRELLAKKPPEAFIRSLAFPGWGQRYAGRTWQGTLFTSVEVGLWTGIFLSREAWLTGRDNYILYAHEHANLAGGHDHQFYVNIGNYDTRDEYNHAQRQMRSYDDQYSGSSTWWEWDSSGNRADFKHLRILADRHKNRIYYLVGGLLLNRVASAIDAARGLSRQQKKIRKNSGLSVGFDPSVGGPALVWRGNLGG